MGGGDAKLTGPDLEAGIASDAVSDGSMVLGHAHGEAVLLARRGREVFAVGASCTHYGGPLAEGLFLGDEVRCPWHHACFSLRTGEAMRAPALNPIACFEVAERGGKLFVLGKRPTSRATGVKSRPSSVVIAGAGAAGNACAELLRREGYEEPIALIGGEPSVPVDRPNLSKDYLAGNAPEEWMALRGEDFYRDQKIDLRLDTRVDRIDVATKNVALSNGRSMSYGALVIATGATPVRLPVQGADAPHVFTLRTLSDSRAIIARAMTAKRAVLLGAGFIGLEVAASLRARGLDVHIIAPELLPLARVLGDKLGGFIETLHEQHGVVFHLGTTAKVITPTSVVLATGEELSSDFVVVGAGVSPDVGIAQAAGLTVNRGIEVDEYLRTSVSDVWAAGDVARWPDSRTGQKIRVEHWVVAERLGQIAARNVLGQSVRCDIVPFFWSAHYDVTINYVGHAERWDRIDVAGSIDKRDAAVAYRRGGTTLAVATLGRDGAALEAEAAMERRDEKTLGRIVPA
jgi:apoptosis-inducing factor 3